MLRLSTNFQRLLRNEIASFLPYRKYNYQKDVYNKKLELPDDKYLHHELKSIYSIRNEQPNLYRLFILTTLRLVLLSINVNFL